MLLRIEKNATTINLDRFDVVRAIGSTVKATSGAYSVKIAECQTPEDAKSLERAIYDAWLRRFLTFKVDKWFHEHDLTFE